MIFSFRTIKGKSEGFYKEKGSKFLAFAFPVLNEDEVKMKLDQLRKEFFDARHHCYAFVLGADKKHYRASDDGEPNHSAGDPILGQIRSFELTNVLVVVVRYFGGTKLGVGGLITAYKTAAFEALNLALIIEEEVNVDLTIEYAYEDTATIMRLVKDFELEVISQEFVEQCFLKAHLKLKLKEEFVAKTETLLAMGSGFKVKWA